MRIFAMLAVGLLCLLAGAAAGVGLTLAYFQVSANPQRPVAVANGYSSRFSTEYTRSSYGAHGF